MIDHAVSFDCFGTLVFVPRPEDPASDVGAALSERGVDLPGDWATAYLEPHVDVPEGGELSLPEHARQALASRGVEASEAVVADAVRAAFTREVTPLPGAAETLAAIDAPVGVFSNCSVPGMVSETLERAGLHEAFDTVETSVDCGWRKPDSRAFVEAGSGVGNSVPSLLDWGVKPVAYRGVDADADIVAFARGFVPKLLRRRGDAVEGTETGCRLGGAANGVPVSFVSGDALTALPGADADLLIAQSFLDLVPIEEALDSVARSLAPGGLAYAPLTFDGVTLFQPDHPADEAVVAAYHDAIDAEPDRDSRAGRRLLDRLREREESLLCVAASDWIVRPVEGRYRADERYFLACILEFVAEAIDGVDGAEDWLAARREQLAAGELTFVAHGYDLLWQRPV